VPVPVPVQSESVHPGLGADPQLGVSGQALHGSLFMKSVGNLRVIYMDAAIVTPTRGEFPSRFTSPVAGPVASGWAEATLTRAHELEALAAWARECGGVDNCEALAASVTEHIEAAKEAAIAARTGRMRVLGAFGLGDGPLRERAMSNLHAAETQLLDFAPVPYLLGQVPSLLTHVRCHLVSSDPRRQAFERIARKLGVVDVEHPLVPPETEPDFESRQRTVSEERDTIVSATRAAGSAAMREQLRLRSFRLVLAATTLAMTLLVIGVAVIGLLNPALIPLCFAPEESGQAQVVCPTAQSQSFPTSSTVPSDGATDVAKDIDDFTLQTATKWDLSVVLLVGLIAAALAAATSIRGIKGSSERNGLPVAMALLKLPTGAITAFLGLLLMRGQFVPGLSALDTSAQILAWALVFGYSQQLFTRLVDKQGQSILDSVRGADNTQRTAPQP
jgi:hypothetical protein